MKKFIMIYQAVYQIKVISFKIKQFVDFSHLIDEKNKVIFSPSHMLQSFWKILWQQKDSFFPSQLMPPRQRFVPVRQFESVVMPSKNPSIYNIIRWFAGTNDYLVDQASGVPIIYFFFLAKFIANIVSISFFIIYK